MKTLRSTVVMLVMTILASLALGSCGSKNDATADFIKGLKECAVKSESAKDVQAVMAIQTDMNALFDKYAKSEAPITDEQKAQIADAMTKTLCNMAPLSLQGMLDPAGIETLIKEFRQSLMAELDNAANLGQFVTVLKATV